MTEIAIKGLAGLEHRHADGSYTPYEPGAPVPLPIGAGDRLHVQLIAPDATWIYAVAQIGKSGYRKLGAWAPAPHANGVRPLWPGGRVLTDDDVGMFTLFVIGARDELPWARDLTQLDCSGLYATMPVDVPTTPCDFLYGLGWKVPPRPRGLVPPKVEPMHDGTRALRAIVSEQLGAPYAVVEWQFNTNK